ncbi:MAG: NADH-quinone oxidoreductase subunit N [Candidatus Thorarchaeota archaeon]|nr:NADH-quinone oxidoreductase subunit N [Candidatus Thorarchaeota archaeon]
MQQLTWLVDALRALFAPLTDEIESVIPTDLVGSLPALTLVAFGLLALLVGLRYNPLSLSLLGVVVASFEMVLFDATGPSFGSLFVRDGLSDFFIYIVLIVAFLMLVSSSSFDGDTGAYNFLLMMSFAGAIWVVMAADLIALFVAWELMSTPTYVLVAMSPNRSGIDGATKYFVMGLMSTMLILLGIALLYGVTGTTQMAAVGRAVSDVWNTVPVGQAAYTILLAIVLLVVAFGFKIGVFPGWMWVPDTYSAADGNIAGYLAGATKKTGVAAIIRLLFVALAVARYEWIWVLALVSVLTMTIGNYLALGQKSVVRMLAFSSIAMMGYLFMGIAASTEFGVAAASFHALVHALMKGGAFILIWAISLKMAKDVTYDDLAGLGKRSPLAAGILAVLVLSLIGVPFAAGFWSKIFLLWSAVDAGLWWLAVLGILNMVMSLGYYVPLLSKMYQEEPSDSTPLSVARAPLFVSAVCAVLLVIMMIDWGLAMDYAWSAGSALFP